MAVSWISKSVSVSFCSLQLSYASHQPCWVRGEHVPHGIDLQAGLASCTSRTTCHRFSSFTTSTTSCLWFIRLSSWQTHDCVCANERFSYVCNYPGRARFKGLWYNMVQYNGTHLNRISSGSSEPSHLSINSPRSNGRVLRSRDGVATCLPGSTEPPTPAQQNTVEHKGISKRRDEQECFPPWAGFQSFLSGIRIILPHDPTGFHVGGVAEKHLGMVVPLRAKQCSNGICAHKIHQVSCLSAAMESMRPVKSKQCLNMPESSRMFLLVNCELQTISIVATAYLLFQDSIQSRLSATATSAPWKNQGTPPMAADSTEDTPRKPKSWSLKTLPCGVDHLVTGSKHSGKEKNTSNGRIDSLVMSCKEKIHFSWATTRLIGLVGMEGTF